MSKILIATGADHGGYKMKQELIKHLKKIKFEVIDFGTNDTKSVDYPDYAKQVVTAIQKGKADMGILVCGSGVGMSIAANRHKGIRAALCYDETTAMLSRQHNDANILVLGGRLTKLTTAKKCVNKFFSTKFEGDRHTRRIQKIE